MNQWNQKTVVITGGSAGLGKEIALAFLLRKATVVVIARQEEALAQLRSETNNQIQTYQCDVTCDDSVNALVTQLNTDFEQIDVWVNNVGKSCRGQAQHTTVDEFEELLNINFLSAVRCTLAILPRLIASGGTLVNIGSLASKIGGMFVGGYPASKFPQAAYSQQLRMELAADSVHVLFVCPGPIGRTEPKTTDYDLPHDIPAVAGRPGGGVRLKLIDPKRLAQKIIRACEKKKLELVIPRSAKLLFAISQIFPRLGDWILRKKTPSNS